MIVVEEESGNILLHANIKNALNITSKALVNLVIYPFITAIIGLLLIKEAIKKGKIHYKELFNINEETNKQMKLKDKLKKFLSFMYASGLFGIGLAFLLLPHSKRTNILMITSGTPEKNEAFS